MRCRFALCLLPLFTTACLGGKPVAPAALIAEPSTPEVRIAQSFEKLEKQVAKLSLIQKAERKIQIDTVYYTPNELRRNIAYYKYTGHLTRIVQDLAEQSGYEFLILGRAPNIPVLISVEWVDISVVEALRDAGAKAGHRATVFVNAEDGRIEVRYD